ncbi:ABC-three component system protein [Catenovulum adriaticum]|uniref:ABC-three component system protein n=1 Tax=Catenovulum adriaticum TaxID=2984846 RepID=UPI002DD65245|nr:ABC-three component system protein [Catenovulum sp. TS8]
MLTYLHLFITIYQLELYKEVHIISNTAPHSAISSYSGFIYQGKVALLHCLKLIADNVTDVQNYELQIDSLDDFAILRNDLVVSLHQVKAKRDDLFSSYKEDFDKQKNKLVECQGSQAYFHVSTPLRSIPETFSDDYPDSQIYKYIYDDNSEKAHCPLSEINQLIEVMLKKALSTLNADEYKLEPRYLELNRTYLEEIICTLVIAIHSDIQEKGLPQNQTAYDKRVAFAVLLEALNQDIQESVNQSSKYWTFLLKAEFGECLNEFCQDQEPQLSISKLEKLAYLACKINLLDDQQILSFSSSIVPHKKISTTNTSMLNYKNGTFDKLDLKRGFFNLLKSINNDDIVYGDSGRNYWLQGEVKYYPTAIFENEDYGDDVCKEILEACMAQEEDQFFERDFLVNQFIDRPNILSPSISSKYTALDDEQSPQHKILNFKKISLISRDKAKELLDE